MRTHVDVAGVMPVEPSAAWWLLTDTRTWPTWGPSIRAVTVDAPDADPVIAAGTTGTVRTVAGVTLPFRVTEVDPMARWTWRVAGVPATGHRVEAHPDGCRVIFEVPMLATPYVAVCHLALRRIRRLLLSHGRSIGPGGQRSEDDAWPPWATQRIEILAWDASWQQQAAALIADLTSLLERWLDGPIEHIGSTAVPGLAAKPVIDLLAPVSSPGARDRADPVLAHAGWQLVPPELDQRPWRRLHVLATGDRCVAHLHLVEAGHPRAWETIAFRDELRRQPALAARYEGLKRSAARGHEGDREAYAEAKTAFIRAVVSRLG